MTLPEHSREPAAGQSSAAPQPVDESGSDLAKVVEAALHVHLRDHLRRVEELVVNTGRRIDLTGELQYVVPA